MLRLFARNPEWLSLGERARRHHERWLTGALTGRIGPHPRIPTRRVSEGGFDRQMADESGRARAERWWDLALMRVESDA